MTTLQDDIRSRARAQRLATCVHWQGALGPKPCVIGVDLVALAGPRSQLAWGCLVPCWGSEQAVFECDRKVCRTEAELDAEQQALLDAADQAVAVLSLIPCDKSIRSGEVTCPKCSGTIDWSRSDYNGHLRVACRTPDCLSITE